MSSTDNSDSKPVDVNDNNNVDNSNDEEKKLPVKVEESLQKHGKCLKIVFCFLKY